MRESKHPVILAAHIRPAIEDGAWMEIECVEGAVRGGNTHKGKWKVYVCAQDETGDVSKAVFVVGRDLEPRIFKTVAGLMSFCIELGHKPFICPFEEGDVDVWNFDSSRKHSSR